MWYCYILASCATRKNGKPCNATYNGKTNDPTRRLRQHNGEIVGGAKATHNSQRRPWRIICLIQGFLDERDALRCEWRIKHPTGKRGKRLSKFCRPEGRIRGLKFAIDQSAKKNSGWTRQCEHPNSQKYAENKLVIKVLPEFARLLEGVPEFCEIQVVESLP